ncbi:MAG: hypothetical protein E7391_06570 [Ruminococcaceae bacterium]|nr:hypothetical protein [Oscillospiraceae bacterium]
MKEYIINLSTENYDVLKTDIKIKQNDYNSALFIINTDFEFDSAILKFKLPNMKIYVSNNYTIEDGTVKYIVENDILNQFGNVMCEISFLGENERITTNTFYFEVLEEINCKNAAIADNKLPILENLIKKCEDLNNTSLELTKKCEDLSKRCESLTQNAQNLYDNQPSKTLSGNYAYFEGSQGIKKNLKIYGNNTSSKLICSDGGNMAKFLSVNNIFNNTAKDFLFAKDNKVYVDNLKTESITASRGNFSVYFDVEPFTLYKDIPYTVTNSVNNIYPYIIMYDSNNKQIATAHRTETIILEKNATVRYIRIWYNFSTDEMQNYSYDGFLDVGVYAGEYTKDNLPENKLENKFEIDIPQMSDTSYIYTDNSKVEIFENGEFTDISDTSYGKEILNFAPYKGKCSIYSNSNFEITYFEDINKVLERYELKS